MRSLKWKWTANSSDQLFLSDNYKTSTFGGVRLDSYLDICCQQVTSLGSESTYADHLIQHVVVTQTGFTLLHKLNAMFGIECNTVSVFKLHPQSTSSIKRHANAVKRKRLGGVKD
eukprot:904683_1